MRRDQMRNAYFVSRTMARKISLLSLPTKQPVEWMTILGQDDFFTMVIDILRNSSQYGALGWLSQTCKKFYKNLLHIQQDIADILYKMYEHNQNHRLEVWYKSGIRSKQCPEQFFRGFPAQDLFLGCVPHFALPVSFADMKAYEKKPKWPPREITPEERNLIVKICIRSCQMDAMKVCKLCGYQYKLQSVWHLHGKLCEMCFKDNLISNTELFLEYGVLFWRYLEKYPDKFEKIFFCSTEQYSNSKKAIASKYTWTYLHEVKPFASEQVIAPRPDVFFWMPHLNKMFNMQAIKATNLARKQSACVLTGYIRAFYLRMVVSSRNFPETAINKVVDSLFKQKLPVVAKSDIYCAIRHTILNQPLVTVEKVQNAKTIRMFLNRFKSHKNIANDPNPRFILETVRNIEGFRAFNYVSWVIEGGSVEKNIQLLMKFQELVRCFPI